MNNNEVPYAKREVTIPRGLRSFWKGPPFNHSNGEAVCVAGLNYALAFVLAVQKSLDKFEIVSEQKLTEIWEKLDDGTLTDMDVEYAQSSLRDHWTEYKELSMFLPF